MDRWKVDQERLDFRSAIVASTIANAFRDSKKKKEPFTVDDFMPTRAQKKKTQSVDDAKAAVKMLHETFSKINQQKGGGK